MKRITWDGNFKGNGAYPTINRNLTSALRTLGATVLENRHNDSQGLTRFLVSCRYPITPSNYRHRFNLSLSTWEFPSLPKAFMEGLRWFDIHVVKSRWALDNYRKYTDKPLHHIPNGFDPDEFTPEGDVYPLNWDGVVLLWVGGTDPRHGLDVARQVIERLPKDYLLLVKQASGYPADFIYHPRIRLITEDLPSLAPLYRRADLLLHTARAVGFSLPVLEAGACGKRIVSNALPTLIEMDSLFQLIYPVEGTWKNGGKHHVHPDVWLEWIEPDVDGLVECVRNMASYPLDMDTIRNEIVVQYSWESIAQQWLKLLESL